MNGENKQNKWQFRWLGNFGFLVSQASSPSPGCSLTQQKRGIMWMKTKLTPRALFKGFVRRPPLGSCAGSGEEKSGCQKSQLLEFQSRAPASIFLASPKAQKHLSLTHLIPRPHLERSEDLSSFNVVPLIVLKAPGVGEDRVISISTTVQTC